MTRHKLPRLFWESFLIKFLTTDTSNHRGDDNCITPKTKFYEKFYV